MFKIKPIEWDNEPEYPHYPNDRKGHSGSPDYVEFTFYLVERSNGTYSAGVRTNIDMTMESSQDYIGGLYPTIDDAKQACQSWYETSIRSFLLSE